MGYTQKSGTPKVPMVLVGTKLDLRDDPNYMKELANRGQAPVSSEEGQKVCSQIGAYSYCECSAKTQKGLKEVFNEAIRGLYYLFIYLFIFVKIFVFI